MKRYLIDEDLANEILNYLSHQPYREVYQFVQQLQALPEYSAASDENFVAATHQVSSEPV